MIFYAHCILKIINTKSYATGNRDERYVETLPCCVNYQEFFTVYQCFIDGDFSSK